MYRNGDGVEKSEEESKKWLQMASRKGYKLAQVREIYCGYKKEKNKQKCVQLLNEFLTSTKMTADEEMLGQKNNLLSLSKQEIEAFFSS